ncbi:hypothetical protein A1OO_08575 [Enterovibrio norvegicus FF-33]|uniref:hypothetical protein n=1 Tax=Enterovibrio norvegicus TaxID=188144 RepID=UPI00031437B5|nr:hypothetical protein [Enterovibrio norvegicus]OEE65853.1 hypothetical protein A1OO_08575 [Enterovibrio norvegicus FF-33]
MREVPVSAFVPRLRTLVNVPLIPLMESAVVDAAIQFCRQSQVVVYTRRLDRVYAHQTLSAVERAGINRRTQGRYKSAGIYRVERSGVTDKVVMTEDAYQALSLDEVSFTESASNVTLHAVIEPQQGTAHLPALLFEDWALGICAGAASFLLRQPDKEWSNVQLGVYQEREFVEQIRKAKRWRLEHTPALNPPHAVRKHEFF